MLNFNKTSKIRSLLISSDDLKNDLKVSQLSNADTQIVLHRISD